ncbi:MAG TPA: saccharopine dehydrogenase C-terminal domain-containing protein [Candidatus Polarisedimenticolaceae bacterium]|nr:saccharopine dehydrogenase C-terminal domain-containing protein [Candidatus Polarisedimenticolaceae bacterium]
MNAVRGAVVLGAGRVGALIARDLAGDPGLRVLAVDRSSETLAPLQAAGLTTEAADLGDPAVVARLVSGAGVIVCAVPGRLGFGVLREAIAAGRPVVDIAFSPEDPFELQAAARASGACVVVDCGVAPGLSNWFVGRAAAELDEIESVEILVGGLPFQRVWPFDYRAPFSPADVVEEYTRPCRMREHGVERVVPALSGCELVDFPEVGTLEAFYTDGLRTLLHTIPAPTLREKTLRYPGHAEQMRQLRASGFFDSTPLRLGDVELAPRAMTEALLFRAWTPRAGEEEFTVLRVEVAGRGAGRPRRLRWQLFDRTDRASGASSMARTTGFPCAIVARMLAAGHWTAPGVHPPETLGREVELTATLLAELRARGVTVERHEA